MTAYRGMQENLPFPWQAIHVDMQFSMVSPLR